MDPHSKVLQQNLMPRCRSFQSCLATCYHKTASLQKIILPAMIKWSWKPPKGKGTKFNMFQTVHMNWAWSSAITGQVVLSQCLITQIHHSSKGCSSLLWTQALLSLDTASSSSRLSLNSAQVLCAKFQIRHQKYTAWFDTYTVLLSACQMRQATPFFSGRLSTELPPHIFWLMK